MSFSGIFKSEYDRKARFYPSLAFIAPIFLWLMLWFPKLREIDVAIIELVILMIMPLIMLRMVREKGNQVQASLVKDWGGFPTTLLLRHADSTINTATKERYHKYLESKVNIKIPSAEDEKQDKVASDKIYDSCVEYLRKNTRDQNKYQLILDENINYGFARNLLGLRPYALRTLISLLILQFILIYWSYGIGINFTAVPVSKLSAILVNLVFILFWYFKVTKQWVSFCAVRYAKALLETCDEHY